MSPRPSTPTVLARVAGLILHAAQARGADVHALRLRTGFDAALLQDANARIPLSLEEALWDGAAAMLGDLAFGLQAATLIQPGAFDVLDYAVRTAPDLRTSLERLARYNRLVHDVAQFRLVDDGPRLRVEHDFGTPARQPCRQASEFTLASLVVVASQIAGAPVRALAVRFAHAAPPDTAPYAAIFGVVPTFGADTGGVIFDAAELRRPLPGADPGLSRIVTAHADRLLAERAAPEPGLAEQIRRLVAEGLSGGPPALADVARRLHLSERSLQRRLDAEGTRFAELVEQVRRELAQRYIADRRLALGEVAYLLGFAEPSPFHRAFKRWTGTTPAAARRLAVA